MTTRAVDGDEDKLNRALLRKAELEGEILADQLSARYRRRETLKLAAALSALLVALTTLSGGIASVAAWYQQQQRDREVKTEERLDNAIALLAAERPAQRIAAISTLKSLWSLNHDRNTRIAVSLANAASVEKDRIAANAILGTFATIPLGENRVEAAKAGLQTLVTNRQGEERDWDEDGEGAEAFPAYKKSIERLIHRGVKVYDMTDMDLSHISLRGVDLSEVKFDRSSLYLADFTGANLSRASFVESYLWGTSFVRANLERSRFGFPTNREGLVPLTDAVKTILRGYRSYQQPDFRCANLSRAVLYGIPIIDLTSDSERRRIVAFGSLKLDGARLNGTDLRNMGATFVSRPDPPESANGSLFNLRRVALKADEADYSLGIFGGQQSVAENPSKYRKALEDLIAMTKNSYSANALFPKVLEPFLPSRRLRGSAAPAVSCADIGLAY